MEQLVEFGLDLYNSVQPLVQFLSTEMEFVLVKLNMAGHFSGFELITVTPAVLLTGSGLVIFLIAKIYKFIMDLIPFV